MSLLRRVLLAAGGGGVRAKPIISSPGTSISGAAILHHVHRKLFYRDGYWKYWIFYWDGYQWVFQVSPDGVSWIEKQLAIAKGPYGRCGGLDVKLRDSNVYITCLYYDPSPKDYEVWFRKGTISEYTINWDSIKKVWPNFEPGDYHIGGGVDKNDDIVRVSWFQYRSFVTPPCWTQHHWSDDEGASWTQQYWQGNEASTTTGCLAFNKYGSDKFLALVKYSDNGVRAFKFQGVNVLEENIDVGITLASGWGGISAVGESDNKLHFVYLKSNNSIGYKYYDDTDFSDEEIVQTGVSSTSFPVLCLDESTGRLICFWAENNKIYYKRRIGGNWDVSPTELLDESTDKLTANYGLTCYERVMNGHICIAYLTKLSSPYTIKHAIVK